MPLPFPCEGLPRGSAFREGGGQWPRAKGNGPCQPCIIRTASERPPPAPGPPCTWNPCTWTPVRLDPRPRTQCGAPRLALPEESVPVATLSVVRCRGAFPALTSSSPSKLVFLGGFVSRPDHCNQLEGGDPGRRVRVAGMPPEKQGASKGATGPVEGLVCRQRLRCSMVVLWSWGLVFHPRGLRQQPTHFCCRNPTSRMRNLTAEVDAPEREGGPSRWRPQTRDFCVTAPRLIPPYRWPTSTTRRPWRVSHTSHCLTGMAALRWGGGRRQTRGQPIKPSQRHSY